MLLITYMIQFMIAKKLLALPSPLGQQLGHLHADTAGTAMANGTLLSDRGPFAGSCAAAERMVVPTRHVHAGLTASGVARHDRAQAASSSSSSLSVSRTRDDADVCLVRNLPTPELPAVDCAAGWQEVAPQASVGAAEVGASAAVRDRRC